MFALVQFYNTFKKNDAINQTVQQTHKHQIIAINIHFVCITFIFEFFSLQLLFFDYCICAFSTCCSDLSGIIGPDGEVGAFTVLEVRLCWRDCTLASRRLK